MVHAAGSTRNSRMRIRLGVTNAAARARPSPAASAAMPEGARSAASAFGAASSGRDVSCTTDDALHLLLVLGGGVGRRLPGDDSGGGFLKRYRHLRVNGQRR